MNATERQRLTKDFTEKDIVVGQVYQHKDYPYAFYLGARTQEYEKCLVIIFDPQEKNTGLIVASIERQNTKYDPRGGNTWWNCFYPVNMDIKLIARPE